MAGTTPLLMYKRLRELTGAGMLDSKNVLG